MANVPTTRARLLTPVAAAFVLAAAFAAAFAAGPPAAGFPVASSPAAAPPTGGSRAIANDANVLHVHVVALRSSSGQVGCTLYASPEGFPEDDAKALKNIDVPIKGDAAMCDFTGLAPGRYALVVIHDENGNGRFDRDLLGIPEEGYAFSNNVRPTFAPPSFDEAGFKYRGGEQWLTITMRY